jgi:NADH:ubiquinone oxidoreductase subunit C
MGNVVEARIVDIFIQVEKALSALNVTREPGTEKLLVIRVTPGKANEALAILARDLGIRQLSTITGLDAGDSIEIDYQFWHGNKIITVKTAVPKTAAEIDTSIKVIPGAVLYEMEVHDMFGVMFKGHPWMERKLLLPDNYPSDLPPPLLKTTSSERIRKAVGVEK